MKKISVVLPCHNEAGNLPLLVPEIITNIPKKYDYEIICVDDGSTDLTASVIEKMAASNKKIKGLIFHRNFGHQKALLAGLQYISGDAVIMMDADFQHPPKLIGKFISLWEAGYDLVSGQKEDDKSTSLLMKLCRKIGYFIWTKTTHGILIPGISDFRLASKEIYNYLLNSDEREFFLRGSVRLASKKSIEVKYHVPQRRNGQSSYNIKMFIDMFLHGFISFSDTPLRIAWVMGIIIFLLAGIYIVADIINILTSGKPVIEGWKTIVLLLLISNGLIFIYLGILSEYIGIIFKEVKRRPYFIIDKKINLKI